MCRSLTLVLQLPNFLLEVELLVFTNIQAISTLIYLLLYDNGSLMCNYTIIYNTCLSKALSWKVRFTVNEKPTPSSVFNLLASDDVQCEEEAGTNRGLSLHTYTFMFFSKLKNLIFFHF